MALRDDAALLILTSLAGGPKHGYAMIEDIATMSGVRLGPGTRVMRTGRYFPTSVSPFTEGCVKFSVRLSDVRPIH